METANSFTTDDIKAFEPENKVGLIATINKENLPHISLITTMQAKGKNQLLWGQFSQGHSKINIKNNPKTGFLIMTMDRNLWKGKAEWTHSVNEGDDYEKFNKLPMWRYNSYFGIHTIHYMDLIETTIKNPLPIGKIILSSILTRLSKNGASVKSDDRIMNLWTESIFNRLDSLKFISYIGEDGYPVILPLLQCQAADSTQLVFNTGVYKDELMKIKPQQDIAIFGLTLEMENVLVRGKFSGFRKHRGINLGTMKINWIYNSMPPIPGQIYPPQEIETVVNF